MVSPYEQSKSMSGRRFYKIVRADDFAHLKATASFATSKFPVNTVPSKYEFEDQSRPVKRRDSTSQLTDICVAISLLSLLGMEEDRRR